jgi:putative flippase GtrA
MTNAPCSGKMNQSQYDLSLIVAQEIAPHQRTTMAPKKIEGRNRTQREILYFILTGGSGVLLNILLTTLFTEYLFGRERYIFGYLIGTTANICYNFYLHTRVTFKTTKDHRTRFFTFVIWNIISTLLQFSIVRILVDNFGHDYYLPIIVATIGVLALLSFVYFKLSLFRETNDTENKH